MTAGARRLTLLIMSTQQSAIRALENDKEFRPLDGAWWDAVKARDRSFDGTFFYSVKTTGVYCRPSCASRLAKRENVSFFASRQDAEKAVETLKIGGLRSLVL